MRYRVTTQRTDLKIHIAPDINSRVIGGLKKDGVYEFEEARRGRWMKLKNRAGWAYSGDRDREPFLTLDRGTPPAPKHLLIFFGGASPGRRPGADLTPGTSAHRVFQDISRWGLFNQSIAKNPAVSNSTHNDAINPVIEALRNWPDSDRVGSVVIYGFSAGGFNALRLCQRISEEIRDSYGLPTGDPRLPRRINLLITIDPCIQDAPGLPPPPNWFQGLDRKAPSVVERHINYYQPQDPAVQGYDGHYHGCPMQGREDHLTGGTHDAMPENTLAFLMHPIRQSVRSNVDAWR